VKRGLVVLDPAEVAPEEYATRQRALQQVLRDAGLRAALIYGDVERSGDVSYLTGLCIYWNEGLLLVPADGEAVFLTKLSQRVHSWMQASSVARDLRSGGDLAALVARALEARSPGALGLVDGDWWPAPLVDALQQRLPGWTWQDMGAVVRRERCRPSAAESALLRRGASVGSAALTAAAGAGLTPAERAGLAERSARLAGVEDVALTCEALPGGGAYLEVLSEFRGYWTQVSRLLGLPTTEPAWAAGLRRAHDAAAARLAPGADLEGLRAAAGWALAGAGLAGWRLELVQHPDLETRGERRLPAEVAAPVAAGQVVGLSLAADLPGGGRAVLADTYALATGGAECLTVA
jgi:hypothetical protein